MILWLSSQLSQKTKDWKSLQGSNGTDVYYSSQGISFNETAFSPRLIFCTQEVAKKSPSTFFAKNLQYSSKKDYKNQNEAYPHQGCQKKYLNYFTILFVHCSFSHTLKITQNVAWNFLILAFSTNFCPIKTDLSGNTV